MLFKKPYLYIFIGALFISCEKDITISSNLGYEFYPLRKGAYTIYDVTTINHTLGASDTSHFQLREIYTDSVLTKDQTTFLMQREKRNTEADNWIIDSVWSVTLNEFQIVLTQNNTPLVKMSFPVAGGTKWNVNLFNTNNIDFSTYESFTQDYTLATSEIIPAGDLIKVSLENIPRNTVNKDIRSEIYVRNIGLVDLDYCILNFCGACANKDLIESGYEEKRVLISYGIQ